MQSAPSTASPRVAFGLRAHTLALKAKTAQLGPAEADGLLGYHASLVPEDTDSHLAAIAFVQRVADDPVGAADALITFLTQWGADPAEIEAALRSQAPQQFAWETRRDTGHD
jgi:hypothetical protein